MSNSEPLATEPQANSTPAETPINQEPQTTANPATEKEPATDRFERAVQELANTTTDERAEEFEPETRGSNRRILDLPVTVEVMIGTAHMSISRLMTLTSGDLVALEGDIAKPLDIFVNGQIFARGELAVLPDQKDRFGVRITEIVGS